MRTAILSAFFLGLPLSLAEAASEFETRRPWETYAILGYGSAVCDNDRPDSDCPVDGGAALGLGGVYRFVPHFAAGLEIAAWAFSVRDEWRGQLSEVATDVKFNSYAVSPFLRWYWFDSGETDGYLHLGIGYGTLSAEATNEGGSYELSATGLGGALGIGAEWWVSPWFRFGPQFLGYLHVSGEICEKSNDESETCRSPSENDQGEREGLALPWRFVLLGTFAFGTR